MNPNCPVCSSGMAPEVNRLRSEGLAKDKIAKQTNFSRSAVRGHFTDCDIPPFSDNLSNDAADKRGGKSLDLDGDSGTINLNGTTEKITDYTKLLELWDLDPEVFEVIEPVRMSTWESGDRQLYSYRARIQKKQSPFEESNFNIEAARELLANPPRFLSVSDGVTYAMAPADGQLGKSGTGDAIANFQRGIIKHVERARLMILGGQKISSVALFFMGDEIEGIAGNYASQTATVELNLSQQLELDFELRVWAIKYIIDELALPVSVVSVISNHGDSWVRLGGSKPVMGQSDNASTHVARLVQKTFELTDYGQHISWHIAKDDAAVVVTLSGTKVYATHGYLQKGSGTGNEAKTVSAMQKQILGDPSGLGDVKVFLTAHYHHFWTQQDRTYTVMGCPALEAKGSSKWLMDMSGIWSEPGMLGFLVGSDLGPLGWNEIAVL